MTTEKTPAPHGGILDSEIEAENVRPDFIIPKEGPKPVSGTEEWASVTVNCCTGCPHDCLYCYARYKEVNRFKRIKPEEWPNLKVRQKDVLKRHDKYSGTVMFPTTHDIVPENLYPCMMVLTNLLTAGNKVLIVSKPWSECIEPICTYFKQYKKQILFRFTIGATDNEILSFWEPNAPAYEERRKCLEHAFRKGFETSVSCEPMLDAENIHELIEALMPFVTNSIWIGKMNKIRSRVNISDASIEKAVQKIEAAQSDEKIKEIYQRYKDTPLIKWKDSIKEVVGLERPTVAGKDI